MSIELGACLSMYGTYLDIVAFCLGLGNMLFDRVPHYVDQWFKKRVHFRSIKITRRKDGVHVSILTL